jgi:peptidoglycan hydrolase-like protein with peptidoglycan-binding domain
MKRGYERFIQLAAVITISIGCASSALAASPDISNKSAKPDILEAEKLLAGLGYWILKVDGKVDASTRHAITAFQKVEGRKRTGVLSSADMEALRNAATPQARHVTGAVHVEIDITRQVLFLVDAEGMVTRILPVSSGNEKKYFDQGKWQIAHTPRGEFRIVRKINGVREASLGSLYYPSYFYGGVAIHGSNSIPAFPASHGCVRIPRFADRLFFGMVSVGTEVFVYD